MAVFRLLGTFALLDGGRSVPLGFPQQRAVLAALLIARGRPVSMTTLIDRLWDDPAPSTARELVYGHIARLRRTLSGYAEIARTAAGYVCEVGPHDVDRHSFDDIVKASRSASDAVVRVSALKEALELWDAEPLGGVPGEWAARTRRAWQRQRINLLCQLNEVELDRGRHTELIFALSALVAEHPTNETLAGQLAVAMHRSGQAGDALDLLRRTRVVLADQQGLDPGPELQELEREILTDARPAAVRPAQPGRHTLPLDLAGFVGRDRTLAALSAAATTIRAGAASVVLLSGCAGVGKTATVLHWAHRMEQEFPGGRYYVDLGGFHPTREPLSPADILGALLTADGVSTDRMPDGVVERAALLAATGADRRLVLLDNAVRSDDIVPVLSGMPGTMVVVVSRRTMPELVIGHGATAVHLDLLSHAEASEVLMRRLAHRVDDATTVDRIARACGHLPLALALIAGRAAAEPGTPLGQLADELDRPERRLDILEVDGLPGLRAAFTLSFQSLSAPAREAFALLSVARGGQFGVAAAAAVLGADLPGAGALIAELHRSNLLRQAGPDRFAFHDLMWLFAEEQARSEPVAARVDAARMRGVEFYLADAVATLDHITASWERPAPLAAPVPPTFVASTMPSHGGSGNTGR